MKPRPEYYDYTYDMFIASIDGEQSEASRFSDWIDAAERDGVYAFEAPRLEGQKTMVHARRNDGTPLHLLNFSSYNYLGYGMHREVIDAAKAALDQYGLGACSSPVQAGTNELHKALEQQLIEFVGLPGRGVSLFSSGYAVNTGTISALMKRRHHIVIDKSAHMSILEGAQLARSKVHYFEHNDADHLKKILEEIAPTASRILVCTEGVFSADGDYGALDKIVPLAKSYGAQVLVDEAHSFGLCGKQGRGVAEELGVLDQVDYLVVTFSKALGGIGGAVITRHEIARYINWYARCRMFSCALDPAVTAGVTKALELAGGSDGAARRTRLQHNAAVLRGALEGHVNTGRSRSWIVPVIYGPENLSIPLADWLQRHGLDGSVMSFPAVPVNEARIRLFVTSEHDETQLQQCADIVRGAAVELEFTITKKGTP
ncbi:MAG: Glycine C-acetyltransferase [Myxococcales bacterium]|nr:Glycine C-acetyltransferase [Myxococcales bacterium]